MDERREGYQHGLERRLRQRYQEFIERGKGMEGRPIPSVTLSLRHHLRVAALPIAGALLTIVVITGVTGSYESIIPKPFERWQQMTLASGDEAEYQPTSVESTGLFIPLISQEELAYVRLAVSDILPRSNPELGDRSVLEVLENLGYKPQKPINILDKNISMEVKEYDLITRVPVPITDQSKYDLEKYRFKEDFLAKAYAVLPLKDQKGHLHYMVLLGPHDVKTLPKDQRSSAIINYILTDTNEVMVLNPTWMEVEISNLPQELQMILQRME